MIEIYYTKTFLRTLKKTESDLQELTVEKIEKFRQNKNHKGLRVHGLKGKHKDLYAFSVNSKIRVIFEYGKNKKEVFLLDIGSYDVYR